MLLQDLELGYTGIAFSSTGEIPGPEAQANFIGEGLIREAHTEVWQPDESDRLEEEGIINGAKEYGA